MRIVLFCHSLVSCWNHGNAHFLRGVVSELLARGHDVRVFEPEDSWSRRNLLADQGPSSLQAFTDTYPQLRSTYFRLEDLNLEAALDGAHLVLVHEWNAPELVARIGQHRARNRNYRLFFHDTHHRSVTRPEEMARYDLRDFDGVLAFGRVIAERYEALGWARRAFTWHEAADTRVFRPPAEDDGAREGDLIWVGNWGDGERSQELHEYLIDPVSKLGLRAVVHGVRYPDDAKAALAHAGIRYAGFLPNPRVPDRFARFATTVHVPRRPYAQALPGIPTIRVFEALACGIPLICAPWADAEQLFTAGRDFLVARDGAAMTDALRAVLHEPGLSHALREHGLRTIRERHTCAHRVDELLSIYEHTGGASA